MQKTTVCSAYVQAWQWAATAWWGVAATAVFLLGASTEAAAVQCRFGPGDPPTKTRPTGIHGDAIPIDTIIVLMQENRSFDHYFGQLHDSGQPRATRVRANASNPDPTDRTKPPITRYHETQYCEVADLDHSWSGTHREWDGGKMDGFTTQNVDSQDPNGHRTMGYYDGSDLPYYYGLYNTFAIADHYFSSVLSQTFPNRFYLLAGTSFGHIANDFPAGFTGVPAPPFNGTTGMEFTQKTIFELLDAADPPVTWKIYYSQIAFAYEFGYVRSHTENVVPYDPNFAADAMNGTLPQVAFVDPIFIGQANVETDEHPPSNIQVGEQFIADTIGKVMSSPQWYSFDTARGAAVFLTYDEHGGFYDHVRPPRACVPDDVAPMLSTDDVPGEFDRLGIRVPFVLVSPFSRPHYVSHRPYDHTSILRFIETRFDLPALTKRDANADPMLRLFNLKSPPFVTPPQLPGAPLDTTHAADPQCVNGSNSAL
jgi:phospholipase C